MGYYQYIIFDNECKLLSYSDLYKVKDECNMAANKFISTNEDKYGNLRFIIAHLKINKRVGS